MIIGETLDEKEDTLHQLNYDLADLESQDVLLEVERMVLSGQLLMGVMADWTQSANFDLSEIRAKIKRISELYETIRTTIEDKLFLDKAEDSDIDAEDLDW